MLAQIAIRRIEELCEQMERLEKRVAELEAPPKYALREPLESGVIYSYEVTNPAQGVEIVRLDTLERSVG